MPITASALALEVASKGFGTLFSELIKLAFKDPKKTDKRPNLPASRFQSHLENTFKRCTKMKTLISRDAPVDLLVQYVNILFSTRQKDKEVQIDDYELIDQIRHKKRVAVIGTAGGGKTVFMKYLWISYFVDSQGRIPIFLELRRMNDLTSPDVVNFIFRNVLTADEEVGVDSFVKAIAEGLFIFVFDGFDEVAEDKRIDIERQIFELSSRYRENIVIVSGRPDDRFASWQDFTTYKVQPLEKEKVIELIQKIEFDKIIKDKFISELKKELYNQHRSFLSTPLLATIMLLTFQHYAEIPEKMHLFYDWAFDTLFSKHDALKEAYNRKKYTNYSIDIFKRRLSCFCLITYIDQKYEFTRDELLQYLNKSAKMDDTAVDTELFCRDLLESVCIMQQDGLDIIFTHRSFQEYFTAYCLARMEKSKLTFLMPKLAERRSDSVFLMTFDINRDLFEDSYVLSMINKTKKRIKALPSNYQALNVCKLFGEAIIVDNVTVENRKRALIIFEKRETNDDVSGFRRFSQIIYNSYYKSNESNLQRYRTLDEEAAKKWPIELDKSEEGKKSGRMRRSFVLYYNIDGGWRGRLASNETATSDEIRSMSEWFETTGYASWILAMFKCFQDLLADVPKQRRRRGRNVCELLGIG
jgi:NACHT domain